MVEGFLTREIKVEMSERAREYILDHGGVLTIEEAPQTGCCVNHVFVGAHLGKPSEGIYQTLRSDGILIYYDPLIIKEDRKYEVCLEGILRWKTLVVY